MVTFTAAGYVCIDYYPAFDNRYYVTGNGVDVLFNLLEMKKDLSSSIVSAVGTDQYGKDCVEAFKRRNIDTSHLEILEGDTPTVPLYLNGNDRVHGDPVRGVMGGFEFSEEQIRFIKTHEYMHSDFTGKLIPRLPEIRKAGTKVFFDLSNKHDEPNMDFVLENIDVGLVSYEDDIEAGKEFLKYGISKGAKLLVATFGEKGSIAYDGREFIHGDIVPVEKVVNTVGAGDSYFAGFMAAFMEEKSIADCMRNGAERSAKVISVFDPYLD